MTLKIFLQILVFFSYNFLCDPILNLLNFTGILIIIDIFTGAFFLLSIFDKILLKFLQFLMRSGIISRMVYIVSSTFNFCIRKAIGGARDDVWQYASL